MQVRRAGLSDIPAIKALYHHLFAAMERLEPEIMRDVEQDESFLRETIEGEKGDVLLAVEGERPLGFALVRQEKTPPYLCMVPHEFCFLLDLSVAPEARNRGVGTALLKAVKTWGRERGLDYVELNVCTKNEGAKRLYLKEGFESRTETLQYWI